jgi:DHA2 family multidrug resistance protein-like MFS transporter
VSSAPPERAGSASGLNETSSEFGGALGIAVLGSLVTALYRSALVGSLPANLPREAAETVQRGIGAAANIAGPMADANGGLLLEIARDAFTSAVQVTAVLCALIVVLAALTAIAMFRKLKPAGA